jgi:hypothetical protein
MGSKIETYNRNIDSCKNYFSPATSPLSYHGFGYQLLDGSIAALKVISYFTVIIPLTVGIVWKVSETLKDRVKPIEPEKPVEKVAASILKREPTAPPPPTKEPPATISPEVYTAPPLLTSENQVKEIVPTAPPLPIEEMQSSKFPAPNWRQMRDHIRSIKEPIINELTTKELLDTVDALETNWNEIEKYGQWDEKQQILHLRRFPEKGSDRKWTLPRSVEIHKTDSGTQIYVLYKGKSNIGIKTPKLGEGGFKEAARAVNLETLKSYVHATIDLAKKANKFKMEEKELLEMTTHEIEIQSLFKDNDEIVNIAGWTEYTDKDGSRKIGITLEQCNGGELLDNIVNVDDGAGKILDENLDALMQVVTDLINMLVILEKEKIINRDIKLENIFLHVDENGRLRAKMGDFGLAWTQEEQIKILEADREKMSGTMNYCAPEYFETYLNPEMRSTLSVNTWEMGIVLHTLIAKYLPFDENNYNPNKMPIVFRLTQNTIDKCIEKEISTNNSSMFRCLANSPKHVAFLKTMVSSMLQHEPSRRASPAKLLQDLEAFKNSII